MVADGDARVDRKELCIEYRDNLILASIRNDLASLRMMVRV